MTRTYDRSKALHERACGSMVAGVPYHQLARAPHAIYFERSEGPYLYDVDGNRYLDVQCGYSTLPLGHHLTGLDTALIEQIERAPYLPAVHDRIVAWAEALCARIPSMQKIHFVDSASKATNFAIRLARAHTGRQRFAKVGGGFHGNWESVQYGIPVRYRGDPTGREPLPGVSRRAADDVLLLPHNEVERSEHLIDRHASELCAIIVEPVIGDGYLPPAPGFLEMLQARCDRYGIVLIADEAVTLTLARGGGQELFGMTPQLTTMGKCIGGGLPVGAVGGSDELMALSDPGGGRVPVPSGATLGGHVLAAVAGLNQLERMDAAAFARLRELGDRARAGIAEIARSRGVPELQVTGVGHLVFLHWNGSAVVTHRDHVGCDQARVKLIDEALFEAGYLTCGPCRINLNAAMSDEDLDGLLAAIVRAAVMARDLEPVSANA